MLWVIGAMAAQPDVVVAWKKGPRTLRATPPAGQEISPEAPVDLHLEIGNRTLTLAGDGAWLDEGIELGGLHGPLTGTLDLQLCEKSSGICKPASYTLEGTLPDSRKGSLALAVRSNDGPHTTDADPFDRDVSSAVEAAYTAAKASGDRVLLDFSAIWCPPCNALGAEVLHADDASTNLDGFQVVVVDVDHASSWPLKSRYGVGGYPTVVVTDAAGEALGTIEGYPGKQAFLDRLADLGGSSDFDERVDAFANEPTEEGLRDLLGERPNEVGEVLWRAGDWVEGDGREAVLALLPELMTRVDPGIAPDVLYTYADLQPVDEQPFHWASVAALLKAQFRGTPADRAKYTFYAQVLAKAGQLDEAIAFLDSKTRENPDDPTFLLSAGYLLNEHERYEDALRRLDMAAERSWGDIALRVAKAACESLVGLDRADEAKARAEAVLAEQPAPDEGLNVRTHKYREQLAKFTK